jgi:hypothetical protein
LPFEAEIRLEGAVPRGQIGVENQPKLTDPSSERIKTLPGAITIAMIAFQVLTAIALAVVAYRGLGEVPKTVPAFRAPPRDKSFAEKMFSTLEAFFEHWNIRM